MRMAKCINCSKKLEGNKPHLCISCLNKITADLIKMAENKK